MAETTQETVRPPFTTFNFLVEIQLGNENKTLCDAAFAEVDGLEMSMAPKTIREGGNNARQIHLSGPVSYGQLTLKRGMTSSFDLWDWFSRVQQRGEGGLRATATVVMKTSDFKDEQVHFVLEGCLPIKLKAPALNAAQGAVAIEEMQIVYEMMRLERPPASSGSQGGGG